MPVAAGCFLSLCKQRHGRHSRLFCTASSYKDFVWPHSEEDWGDTAGVNYSFTKLKESCGTCLSCSTKYLSMEIERGGGGGTGGLAEAVCIVQKAGGTPWRGYRSRQTQSHLSPATKQHNWAAKPEEINGNMLELQQSCSSTGHAHNHLLNNHTDCSSHSLYGQKC